MQEFDQIFSIFSISIRGRMKKHPQRTLRMSSDFINMFCMAMKHDHVHALYNLYDVGETCDVKHFLDFWFHIGQYKISFFGTHLFLHKKECPQPLT